MSKTGLIIYPSFLSKTLRYIGSVAVGEKAVIRVAGVGSANGLRVRFRFNGKDAARFPATGSDAWTFENGLASCVVSLNTLQMRKPFAGACDISSQTFVLVVENISDKRAYAEAHIPVKNWPANEGEDIPHNLDGWPDEMDALDGRVTALASLLELHKADPLAHSALFGEKVGTSDFTSHVAAQNAHGVTLASLGGAGANDLSNHKVDARAHSELFDAKADAEAFGLHVTGQELSHSQLDSLVRQSAQKLSEHDHSGGDRGVRVRHSDLIGGGRHSHHQIDRRLDDVRDALNTLSGEVRGLLNIGGISTVMLDRIAAVCRDAGAMPNGSDRERKAQFSALAGGIAAAIEYLKVDGVNSVMLDKIVAVFRGADAMPDGSDGERKAQFSALASGVAEAIEAAIQERMG